MTDTVKHMWDQVEKARADGTFSSEHAAVPAQDESDYEACSRCGGTGLVLGGAGEPTECSTCKGNTVVRTPAAPEDQAAIDEIERLQGLITQLRAQVETAATWQPIETAPGNNPDVEIDLWADGYRFPKCHKHKGEWLFWASDSVDDEPTWKVIKNPTHWLRLSPPHSSTMLTPEETK